MVTFKNMTPSPFIRCYFGNKIFLLFRKTTNRRSVFPDNGKEMVIDVDSKNRHEIEEHLIEVVGKTK